MGARFRAGLDAHRERHALDRRGPWARTDAGTRNRRARRHRTVTGASPPPCSKGPRITRLLVGKGGLYGNVVRMAPMLNVSADEIDEGLAAIAAAAAEID